MNESNRQRDKNNLRIALVEDDESDLFFAQRALADNGFSTPLLHFWTGQEAQAYFQDLAQDQSLDRPDVILIDYSLPGMSGWELMGWLHKYPIWAGLPIVLLSSNDMPVKLNKSAGSFLWILKTIHLDMLIIALEHFIKTGKLEPITKSSIVTEKSFNH